MLNRVREAVSADRRRFKEDGFNLDLSYVTPRIIAMAIPSDGIQAAYRNHMDDVDALLRKNHGENFMIWNLSEFTYDAKFSDKVIHLPFPDHHPPPLDLYLKLVEMMDNWLRADENHVAVVHCKGGKGRTGTVVVSLLFFRGDCATIDEAEQLFASMRSSKSKGVTQPSQRRYIQYFKTVLVQDRLINYQPIRLRSVTIAPLLSVRPILLQIFNGVTDDAQLLFSQMKEPVAFGDSTAMVKFNIELDVRGDLYFKVFRRKDKDKVERAFHVVMHSFFIASTQFILERKDLDHLKSSDKRFSQDLTMTFQFTTPQVPKLYPDRDDLHERMANKYLLTNAGGMGLKSSDSTTDGAMHLTEKGPVALKKKTMRVNKMAHGELHKDGSGGASGGKKKKMQLVYDHPLVDKQVQLALSSGDFSALNIPTAPTATVSSQSASMAVAMKSSTYASSTTSLMALEPQLFEDDDEDDDDEETMRAAKAKTQQQQKEKEAAVKKKEKKLDFLEDFMATPPTEPPPLPPTTPRGDPMTTSAPTTPRDAPAILPRPPSGTANEASGGLLTQAGTTSNTTTTTTTTSKGPPPPIPPRVSLEVPPIGPKPPSLPPRTLGQMRKSRRDLHHQGLSSRPTSGQDKPLMTEASPSSSSPSLVPSPSQDKFSLATTTTRRRTPPEIPPRPILTSTSTSAAAADTSKTSPSTGPPPAPGSTSSNSSSNWSTATPSGSSGRLVRMTARPAAPASTPPLMGGGRVAASAASSPTTSNTSSTPSLLSASTSTLPSTSSSWTSALQPSSTGLLGGNPPSPPSRTTSQSSDSLPSVTPPASPPYHSPLISSSSTLPARASLSRESLSASDELDSGSDSDLSSDSEEYYDMDYMPSEIPFQDSVLISNPPLLNTSTDTEPSEARRGTIYPIVSSPSSESVSGRPTRKAPTIPSSPASNGGSPLTLRPSSASPDAGSSPSSPRT